MFLGNSYLVTTVRSHTYENSEDNWSTVTRAATAGSLEKTKYPSHGLCANNGSSQRCSTHNEMAGRSAKLQKYQTEPKLDLFRDNKKVSSL
jgi:hypothetical protein